MWSFSRICITTSFNQFIHDLWSIGIFEHYWKISVASMYFHRAQILFWFCLLYKWYLLQWVFWVGIFEKYFVVQRNFITQSLCRFSRIYISTSFNLFIHDLCSIRIFEQYWKIIVASMKFHHALILFQFCLLYIWYLLQWVFWVFLKNILCFKEISSHSTYVVFVVFT